ncbi:MAG: hypothetical protein A2Z25_15210 [Planctomycetes bacterium RBG_16_55_9]|nr:MAG: hypothetical protein A2Z25_15210 [Planctomycetes bacterium RBG_16_55_9]
MSFVLPLSICIYMKRGKMNLRNLLGALALGLGVIASGCARSGGRSAQPQPSSLSVEIETPKPVENEVKSDASLLEEKWGIKIEAAMLSAGGYMIDFRFRVLDAAKAAQIFDRKIMPYMIDQQTGATFIVPSPPKIGPLRAGRNIKENKVYFIIFANPARYVKSGSKITVVVGDFKVQDIVVDAVDRHLL